MAQSMPLTIAKILLKRTLFAGDRASAETIWRAQQPRVREAWVQRANEVIADFDAAGLEIRDSNTEDPNYDEDHR